METVRAQVGLWPITDKRELKPGFFSYELYAPFATEDLPGRFVHIRCGDRTLRRPVSVCETDPKAGTVRIVFQVRGEGTAWLAERKVGESLDVLGPLGNGFDLSAYPGRILTVGGGIGVPPMLGIAKKRESDAVLGFRGASGVILADEFENYCEDVVTVTEDGSFGEKGMVTGPAARLLDQKAYACICACGPIPMLKAVAALAAERGIPCKISLEQRMACGVGACLSCVCKVKVRENEVYTHVCKSGPVFDAGKVVFE